VRCGEAPVLARYEGNYAATTVTVMGDRSGFVWKEPERWNKIDELVAAKWQRMKIIWAIFGRSTLLPDLIPPERPHRPFIDLLQPFEPIAPPARTRGAP